MLTQGEAVEVHVLQERGWSISAIARHLERDRKTIRSYLNGTSTPGIRVRSTPDPLEPYVSYLSIRFANDPHVWASSLYDEVQRLGYNLSYPSFVRQLRLRALRPHCEACSGVKGRDTVEIPHPPGEEIQWDWFERRRSPWGTTAYCLLGTLPSSGRVRGTLSESTNQAHLIAAMDKVMRKLGGTARVWRVDRMASVITPGTGDVQPTFAPVAKHYGATVEPCPPRRGNRKGSVESAVRFVSGRWWRTLGEQDVIAAERSLDRFCETVGDRRFRRRDGVTLTVGELADQEPLLALPAPHPATIEVRRVVEANATVHYRGNRYSTPPGLSGTDVLVTQPYVPGLVETPNLERWSFNGSLKRYPPEVRDRAIRMVTDHQGEYASQWAACQSVAQKLSMTPETLRVWVRQAQINSGATEDVRSDEKDRTRQ